MEAFGKGIHWTQCRILDANPYINRMAYDMLIRNLDASTIESCTWHVDKFCWHFGKMPE